MGFGPNKMEPNFFGYFWWDLTPVSLDLKSIIIVCPYCKVTNSGIGNYFFTHRTSFHPSAIFFIPSKSKQKFLSSYGKFLHWETYFFKQKTRPIRKKMPFNVQCKTFITIRNDKKIVLCFSQDFLAFGPFLGFFWPSEGLRPPSGQKNPKNGPRAKKPGCSTIFFVLPHVDIVLHFNVEIKP